MGVTNLIFRVGTFHIRPVSLRPDPDLLACDIFPSYSLLVSPRPPTCVFTLLLTAVTVSSLGILYIPAPHTHVCVSLLKEERGAGHHVLPFSSGFNLELLAAFLQPSQLCGNRSSWQDMIIESSSIWLRTLLLSVVNRNPEKTSTAAITSP